MATAPAAPVETAAPATKALNCPNCGGTVTLRAAGYTVTVACQYCGSLLDVANPDVRLIKKYREAVQELEIPLGTRGTLHGLEWEAIGYMRRSEGGAYPWEEYLLFNPYHGYRWLIANRGGWSFGEQLTRTPDWAGHAIALDGHTYEPFFANGTAQVDYVVGEFYWRVKVGEKVATDDYVRPGFMLSREANKEEISWSLSEWLPPKEVEKAFGVRPLVQPWPPLPHQASPHGRALKTAAKIGFGMLALLLLTMFVFGGSATLFQGSVPVTLDGRPQSATVGPIVLNRSRQIVNVAARSPELENGWIDIDYTLVNRQTQVAYEAYGLAERYSGSDSDGPWTEGDRGATVKIASVPAGTYDLIVEYTGNRWTGSYYSNSNARSLDIRVRRGGVFISNFILAALLILAPMIFIAIRHMGFESARRGESDFASSGSSGDD